MGESAQWMVGKLGRKGRDGQKIIPDAEREENGCVVAGGNEFRLLTKTMRRSARCAELGLEERQPRRRGEKQLAVQGFVTLP